MKRFGQISSVNEQYKPDFDWSSGQPHQKAWIKSVFLNLLEKKNVINLFVSSYNSSS